MTKSAKFKVIFCIIFLAIIPANVYSGSYARDCGEEFYVATFVEDFRYPSFTSGTYITFLYSGYENGASFYSGIVMKGSDTRNIFNNAFWKGSMEGKVEALFSGPTIFPSSTGGEGATGGASGLIPFIHANQWNKVVYKIWTPESDPEGNSNFGLWVMNIKANKWYHIASFRLPVHSRGIKGLGGFFEEITMNRQLQEMHRRRSYALDPEGKWHSLKNVKVRSNHPGKAPYFWYMGQLPGEEGQVLRFANEEKLLPGHNAPQDGKYHTYSFDQPDNPEFQDFVIDSSSVQKFNDQLLISWQTAQGCPPHIGAYVEISDRYAPAKVLEVHHAETSYQDSMQVTTKVKNPVVKLVLRSIFDQKAIKNNVLLKHISPVPAKIYNDKVGPGLKYEYFEPKKDIDSLDTAFATKRKNFGVSKNLDMSIKPQDVGRTIPFALKFDGFVNAPRSGFYQFHVKATDGYKLTVGGETLVYDKPHGPVPRVLNVFMSQGMNRFELDYFNARHGEEWLDVSWAGPQLPLQKIEDKSFFQSKSDTPVFAIKLNADDSMLKAAVESVGPAAPTIGHVEYYAGKRLWGKTDKAPFSITSDAIGGKQSYWARIYFDDDSTVTTAQVPYEHNNVFKADDTWEYIRYSHAKSPVSYNFDTKKLSMSGLGRHGIMKDIKGDFTLKVKVNEQIGGLRRSYVALVVNGRTFGIYSVNAGLCLPTHQRDFGGGTFGNLIITDSDEPKDVKWLCLARKGKHFITYYSHDGKKWHKANEIFTSRFSRGCKAGIVFDTHLKIGSPYFSVKLDNISFVPRFDESLMPEAEEIDLALKESAVTGFIYGQSKENPDRAYARTTEGLLMSEDFGKTWKKHYGSSAEKADGMIRSLAVNPANPDILYCGEIEGQQSKLLLSKNGGRVWKKVNCPVSFCNIARDNLMGEVLAIDDDNPERVLVGGTTDGVYLSEDEGESWKLIGHNGEYVSFVQFNKGADPRVTEQRLYVGVIPQESLALWQSSPDAPGRQQSKVYIHDLKSGKVKSFDTPAPAIDIRFQPGDKYKWLYIATMRGVFESVNNGYSLLQMFSPKEFSFRKISDSHLDQPVTAFDMSYQNRRQNMMYALCMKNLDQKNPQAFYMKKPFKVKMPALDQDEHILKMLCHPTETPKAILATDKGLLYSTTGTQFERHNFERAAIE